MLLSDDPDSEVLSVDIAMEVPEDDCCRMGLLSVHVWSDHLSDMPWLNVFRDHIADAEAPAA